MINIIGAGPIGTYTAYLLAKKGLNSTIFEEHHQIGIPEQCTGLVNQKITNILRIPHTIIKNTLKGATFHCGKTEWTIHSNETKALLLDRTNFDQYIAELAQNEGVTIKINEKYINHTNTHTITKSGEYAHETLIGADGAASKVAKNANLWQDREFYLGLQYIMKNPGYDADKAHIYLDKKYSNFFTWIVPENEDYIKVGLLSENNCSQMLNKFIYDKLPATKIIKVNAGLVPKYKDIKLTNGNVHLIGDAGLMLKKTTGGGIISGLLAAQKLTESITNKTNDYEKRIKIIRKNLSMHSLIRNKLDKINDKETENILTNFNNKKTERIFLKYGDMDHAKTLMFKLGLNQPNLLKYLLK